MNLRKAFSRYTDGTGSVDFAGALCALADLGVLELVDVEGMALELQAMDMPNQSSRLTFGAFHRFHEAAYRTQRPAQSARSPPTLGAYLLQADLQAAFNDCTAEMLMSPSVFIHLMSEAQLATPNQLVMPPSPFRARNCSRWQKLLRLPSENVVPGFFCPFCRSLLYSSLRQSPRVVKVFHFPSLNH